MPFALLIIGLVLLASAIAGTQQTLLNLVVGDFSGQANFFYWIVALLIIGSIGYIPRLKPVSDLFLVLVIVVLLLSAGKTSNTGGGFFKQFTAALGTTNTPEQVTATGGTSGVASVLGAILGGG